MNKVDSLIMITVLVFWISISLSLSGAALASNIAFFGLPLFTMYSLLAYRTPLTFWLCVSVLIAIVLRELRNHLFSQPQLIAFAQIFLIAIAFIQGLHTLTRYFIPEVVAAPYVQVMNAIFRFRIIIAACFLGAVLLGSAIKTFWSFSFKYRESVGSTNAVFFLLPIIGAINLIINFIIMVGTFLGRLFYEAGDFVYRVIFNRVLWKAIWNIALTSLCLFALAVDVILVREHLARVLRSPTIFLRFDVPLMWSNLILSGAFLTAMFAIFVLARIWRPKWDQKLQAVDSRIVIAAGAIYICSCLAAMTYQIANYVFRLQNDTLSWPGVYFVFAIALSAYFVVREFIAQTNSTKSAN